MRLQRSRSIWIAAGVAGFLALVHLIWFFSHPDAETRELFTAAYTPIISALSGFLLLFAGWRQRKTDPRGALAWTIFGLAQLCTAAGDATWYVMEFLVYEPPSPSLGDVFYLLNYPVFLAGVLLLMPKRELSRQWLKTSIDMAIVMFSVVLILWNYLLGPIVIQNNDSILLLAVTMAYPVGDLMLIWALLVVIYRNEPAANTRYLDLLAMGMSLVIIYDFIFLNQTIEEISLTGNWADLIYTLAFAVIGLAGWCQANAQNEERSAQIVVSQGAPPVMQAMSEQQKGWKVILPYIWLGLAYAMVIVRDPATSAMSPMVISLFVGVIIALILARQILTIRENHSLNAKLFATLTQVQQQTELLENANREMEAEIKERLRVENRLAHDALHDHLTGLPNRALFLDRLARAGRMKKRHPDFGYAVLFLDLDSFKLVNDSLGHVTGDQLLVSTARTLMDCVRTSDTVARLGGDEFVILLEDINTGDAVRTSERLQSELAKPVQLNTNRVFVSVSIGIVQDIDGYEFPEEVLRDADLAMYHAKAHGKARYEIFQTSMRASVITRLALENDMRRALEKKEFVLHYQPILSLPGQRLVGFEALVRWNHPDRGLVPPMEFIPVAEETGLILPLGEWILHEACLYARRWIKLYPDMSEVKVSVNISGKQLKQPDFIETVRWALNDTGLPASNLALEVTESVCLDSLDTVANTLLALQALGVETQIDDFGTGYSSLSYLQRLPVKSIKIDRSFTQTINNSNESTPDLVRAIFSMVNNLGIKAVAEGIETEVQLEELNRLNCAYVQGYFLALPMTETGLESWMVTNYSLPKPADGIHRLINQVKD